MADSRVVGLDWRFGIPLEAVRITLRELKGFYEDGTRQFNAQVARLQMRAKELSPEDYDQTDYLSDLMTELEGMRDLMQEFAIIGVFRSLERFLRLFLNRQRHAGVVISDETARYLDSLKDQYKEIGIELTQPPFDWREIKKLQKIRNCIAHDEGWIDEKRAAELRSCQLSVKKNDWIKLPQGYFFEPLKLVDKTCELVIDKCREAARAGKVPRMNWGPLGYASR